MLAAIELLLVKCVWLKAMETTPTDKIGRGDQHSAQGISIPCLLQTSYGLATATPDAPRLVQKILQLQEASVTEPSQMTSPCRPSG